MNAREEAIELLARAWWWKVTDGFVPWPDRADGASRFIIGKELERAEHALDALISAGWSPSTEWERIGAFNQVTRRMTNADEMFEHNWEGVEANPDWFPVFRRVDHQP